MHLYFSRLRASLREGPDRKWLLPWGSSTDRAQRDVWKRNRAGWRKGAGWELHLKRDLKWLQVGNEQVDSYTEPRRVLPHLAAGAASPGRYSDTQVALLSIWHIVCELWWSEHGVGAGAAGRERTGNGTRMHLEGAPYGCFRHCCPFVFNPRISPCQRGGDAWTLREPIGLPLCVFAAWFYLANSTNNHLPYWMNMGTSELLVV